MVTDEFRNIDKDVVWYTCWAIFSALLIVLGWTMFYSFVFPLACFTLTCIGLGGLWVTIYSAHAAGHTEGYRKCYNGYSGFSNKRMRGKKLRRHQPAYLHIVRQEKNNAGAVSQEENMPDAS